MARVLILGATSAIAGEVARIHAKRGDRVHLVGRSATKLAELAASLPPGVATSATADFADLAHNEAVIGEAIGRLGGLDTVLVAHGDLGDQLESERSFDEAERIFRANCTSVVSLLIPIANHMERAGAGRIGVITSVAGERGRPRNFTYGAAKGALNVFLQGLRSRLVPSGVKVTTLKLGPVDTPMTRDHKKNVLFAQAKPVAESIVAAMDRGRSEVYVPAVWGLIMPIVKNTPEWLFQRLRVLSDR